jgi:hypothetical protein
MQLVTNKRNDSGLRTDIANKVHRPLTVLQLAYQYENLHINEDDNSEQSIVKQIAAHYDKSTVSNVRIAQSGRMCLTKDQISQSKEFIQKLNPNLISCFGTLNAESKPTLEQACDSDDMSSVKERICHFQNLENGEKPESTRKMIPKRNEVLLNLKNEKQFQSSRLVRPRRNNVLSSMPYVKRMKPKLIRRFERNNDKKFESTSIQVSGVKRSTSFYENNKDAEIQAPLSKIPRQHVERHDQQAKYPSRRPAIALGNRKFGSLQ